MSAELRLETDGLGDDEAINHAMQELARYQQAVLLVEQLSALMGYLRPDLEAELTEYRQAVSDYTEKMAVLLAKAEQDEEWPKYLLDAIEYADTYRQQRYVYGIFAPMRVTWGKQ